MGIWTNAFKIPVPPEVTAEEKALLDALAGKIRRRGMGDMAAMALESTRPMHNLGAQGAVFLSPMLNIIFNKEDVGRYVKMLENPKAVSYLSGRLASDEDGKNIQGEPNVPKRS